MSRVDILAEIAAYKRSLLPQKQQQTSIAQLESSPLFGRETHSLKHALARPGASGVIAEYKRQSPSAGVINATATVEETTKGYLAAGASALSILTDSKYFGGQNADLSKARSLHACPLLRKDFTLSDYDLVEAKSIGADVILLIAAMLQPDELKQMADTAHSMGLEVLLEVHSAEELPDQVSDIADVLGVNNRNLKTMVTDVQTSLQLAELLPQDLVKISESGISNPATIAQLRAVGYQGFLIGESFMRQAEPSKAAAAFIQDMQPNSHV